MIHKIRTFEVTTLTRHAADNRSVRQRLSEMQRQIAHETNVVTEGRDQATVVFPQLRVKNIL